MLLVLGWLVGMWYVWVCILLIVGVVESVIVVFWLVCVLFVDVVCNCCVWFLWCGMCFVW